MTMIFAGISLDHTRACHSLVLSLPKDDIFFSTFSMVNAYRKDGWPTFITLFIISRNVCDTFIQADSFANVTVA